MTMESLHPITLDLLKRRNIEDLLSAALEYAGRLIGANHGFIQLLEPGADELRMRFGRGVFESYVAFSCQPGEGLSGKVWNDGRGLFVNDYDNWDGRSPKIRMGECRALAGVPLYAEGSVTGVLALAHSYDEPGKSFSEADVAVLCNFAELASAALENVRLYSALNTELAWRNENQSALERHLEFERTVTALAALLLHIAPGRSSEAMRQALQRIGTFCNVDRAYILRLRDGVIVPEVSYVWTAPGVPDAVQPFFGLAPTDFRWVEAQIAESGMVDISTLSVLPPGAQREREMLEARDVKSLLSVPLLGPDSFFGYLTFDMVRGERVWDADTIAMLRIAAQLLTAVLERQAAEEQRLAAEEQYRQSQKLESLAVMAGGLAHDYNNLLAAIVGNLYLAENELEAGSPGREAVAQAQLAATRAAELTQQLLTYSGHGRMQPRPHNLTELIAEWRRGFKSLVHENAELVFDLAPDLPAAQVDPGQIKQMLKNTIINASEALDGHHGLIRVRSGHCHAAAQELCSAASSEPPPEGDYVFIEISDTGVGMDGRAQQQLFDPFFSTKFTGRGLGMAAVLGVVRSHGGAIQVSSQPGAGTVIRILIPAYSKAPSDTDGSGRSPEGASADEQSPLTVLVVDDEPSIRSVVSRALKRHNFTVHAAEDGQTGIEMLKRHAHEIDAVLLDVTMPGMKGTEVLGVMQQMSPGLPIVLSSGYREEDTLADIDGREPAGFIQKPYSPMELVKLLRKVVPAR